jgi:hypothetical protein
LGKRPYIKIKTYCVYCKDCKKYYLYFPAKLHLFE